MPAFKIGDGTDYANPTDNVGFAFPENPRTLTITTQKKVDTLDYDLQDFNTVLDKGARGGQAIMEGEFAVQTDMNDLRKAANYVRYFDLGSGEQVDMYYEKKFWHKSNRFWRIKGIQVDTIRNGLRPLLYPYRAVLQLVDIFEYDDTENVNTASGSSVSVNGVANSGDVYTLPIFEVDVTSSISKVTITYLGKTITFHGTVSAGQRLRIDQLIQQVVIFSNTSTTTPLRYKSYSGLVKISPGATGQSFSFTLTGGSGTCRVRVRPRYF